MGRRVSKRQVSKLSEAGCEGGRRERVRGTCSVVVTLVASYSEQDPDSQTCHLPN